MARKIVILLGLFVLVFTCVKFASKNEAHVEREARVLCREAIAYATDTGRKFPEKQSVLVDKKHIKEIQKYKSVDGHAEDYVWLGGYRVSDPARMVLFYAPEEVAGKILVARLGGEVEFVASETAAKQIKVCKEFLVKIENVRDGEIVFPPEF